MKQQDSKIEPHWLNKRLASASCGICQAAFDKWNVKPVARIGRETFFDIRSILDNRLANFERLKLEPLRSKQLNDPDEGTLEYERLRLTKAQAENMEIKNEIAKGSIAPVELITWVLSDVAGEAAGEIDAIPLSIRRKHPMLENRVIEDIKRHCVKAQNAIARVDERLGTKLDEYLDKLNQSSNPA